MDIPLTDADRAPLRVPLWTASYQNPNLATERTILKLGTSLGHPKFRLDYELHYTRILAPTAPMLATLKGDPPAFAAAYRALLESRGLRVIGTILRGWAHHDPATTAVCLLCFEDLRQPGAWCHRRLFADWWQEMTDQVVAELPDFPAQGALL